MCLRVFRFDLLDGVFRHFRLVVAALSFTCWGLLCVLFVILFGSQLYCFVIFPVCDFDLLLVCLAYWFVFGIVAWLLLWLVVVFSVEICFVLFCLIDLLFALFWGWLC